MKKHIAGFLLIASLGWAGVNNPSGGGGSTYTDPDAVAAITAEWPNLDTDYTDDAAVSGAITRASLLIYESSFTTSPNSDTNFFSWPVWTNSELQFKPASLSFSNGTLYPEGYYALAVNVVSAKAGSAGAFVAIFQYSGDTVIQTQLFGNGDSGTASALAYCTGSWNTVTISGSGGGGGPEWYVNYYVVSNRQPTFIEKYDECVPLTAGWDHTTNGYSKGAQSNAFAVSVLVQGEGSTVTIARTSANLFGVELTNDATIVFEDSWTTGVVGTVRLDLLSWSYTVTFPTSMITLSSTNLVLSTNQVNALIFDKAWKETLWHVSQLSP